MWPCKRCLRQEGCLCQVPVALLWGSTCPVLYSSSTRVALLCWLTWTELLNRLISAGSCFCTAWQGRNPVLGLYFYKAMPHPALCAYAQKAGIQEERSSGEGACFPYKSKSDPKLFRWSVCLAAICRVCCDVGDGTLPQVLCSEKQGVLQPHSVSAPRMNHNDCHLPGHLG